MSTHEAKVIKIENLKKHPDADSLSLINIWGYTVVVRTEDWREGQLAVYIEPDTCVDTRLPEFSFLQKYEDKPFERIKVKKLRGIYSQGCLIPAPENLLEGDDAWEQLKLSRYVPKPVGTGNTLGKASSESGISLPAPKYDLENYKKYKKVLVPDEEIVLTEKLHGCFHSETKITLVSGDKIKIGKIVKDNLVGLEILGQNKDGDIVPSKILNVFNNGYTERWLKVKGTRIGYPGGNKFFSFLCTPNHFIKTNTCWKMAKELDVGDVVYSYRASQKLTPLQFQTILGKALGDGSFSKNGLSAHVRFSHKKDHKEYVEWTLKALGNIAGSTRDLISGYGTDMLSAKSLNRSSILEEFKDFMNDDSKKEVPEWVANKLGPIAIAFWYMDDGSLSHDKNQKDRACFATNGFSKKSCEILQKALKKFDIESVLYNSKGWRIRLNIEDAEKMFLLISPYVPKCMQYKLPENFRSHDGWLPKDSESVFDKELIEQKILSVEEVTKKSTRYDLETETHNYLANDVLVHNCNSRFVWHKDRMWAGSRTRWIKRPEDDNNNVWWKVLSENPWIEEFCKANPDSTLYGEIFGWVQDLKYGHGPGEHSFKVFDVWRQKDENWGYVDAIDLMKTFDKEQLVPVLYVGPYSDEVVSRYTDGKTMLDMEGKKHIREGCVLKPIRERINDRVGRVALKSVSDKYLEKATD